MNLQDYNYDAFIAEKFEQWMRFDESPPLGRVLPGFSVTDVHTGEEVSLQKLWRSNLYTIMEFGSFT